MSSLSSILESQKRIPKTEKSRIGNKRLLFRDIENFSLKSQLIELKITVSGEQEINMKGYRTALHMFLLTYLGKFCLLNRVHIQFGKTLNDL